MTHIPSSIRRWIAAYLAESISDGPTCIEFDGNPKCVDAGRFYPSNFSVLGNGFYECWTCILPGGGSGKYDFSDGYGGSHAMLRNPVNGNFLLGSLVTGATNASPIEITTGGTFLLRGAQNVADASNTVILRGSYMTLTKLN